MFEQFQRSEIPQIKDNSRHISWKVHKKHHYGRWWWNSMFLDMIDAKEF